MTPTGRANFGVATAIAAAVTFVAVAGCAAPSVVAGSMTEVVSSPDAPKAIGPYSQGIKTGNLLFLSAQGPLDAKSGQMSTLLPVAGVAGAMICGMGTGMMGRRKPFMWPLMVLALGASLTIATFPVGPVVYLAIAAFGFATAGLSPPLMTTVMDLKGATAEFIGGAFAIIYGVSFISSFFVSPAFGALVPILGARSTMTLFSLPLILSIVLPALLSETGPKRQIRAHATPGS